MSPEAQASLRRPAGAENQTRAGEASFKAYPVKIESLTIAGVSVRNILPLDATPQHPDHVLINVHGGAAAKPLATRGAPSAAAGQRRTDGPISAYATSRAYGKIEALGDAYVLHPVWQ